MKTRTILLMGLTMVCTTLFSSCGGGGGGDDSLAPYTMTLIGTTGVESSYTFEPSTNEGEGTLTLTLSNDTEREYVGTYEWQTPPDTTRLNDAQSTVLRVWVAYAPESVSIEQLIKINLSSNCKLMSGYADGAMRIDVPGTASDTFTIQGPVTFSATPH